MTEWILRTATQSDLDRLIAIHTAVFPDSRGPSIRNRNFTTNPLGTLDDLFVVIENGRIVAHAFLFPLAAFFGGIRVAAGGIATVGVAPEARGRGIATWLLDQLHRVSHDRGDAITMLYAFRQKFYGQFGYAHVGPYKHLAIDTRSIPAAWVHSARSAHVRAATGSDRDAVRSLYLESAVRQTGTLDRPQALWDHLLLDERVHPLVLHDENTSENLAGFVAFEHLQTEAHAETKLVVRDLVGRDAKADRILYGLLGAQRDQVTRVEIDLPADDSLDLILEDGDGCTFGTSSLEHSLGAVAGGPMIRLNDVRALEARGYAHNGEIELRVDEATYKLIIHHHRMRVYESPVVSPLALDRKTLAAITFGSLTFAKADKVGLIQGNSDSITFADRIFAAPPFFSRDRF